uniref:Nicotinic acetylcholine receptor subunit n=1 Tax=Ciona intestinalis TaxID=7719 RepID=E7FIZ2_CIOIN|nr:nicotinic acetylcholine receptor subunit precursor [Ciona intestinalis]BAJ65317.1 nicotinic acetylcholine receptor subunit [Ciona intestinalis]|eukprot:NP_001191093.1 nicotinic acetylcholine receptor subunit precursor [Ciona intestinalis]
MDFSFLKLVQWKSLCILACLHIGNTDASKTDEKLSQFLFSNYNKHIRPARTLGDVTNVTFYLTLLQLISVTEKSEEMTTSQYVTIRWEDPRLIWNPKDFGGVTQIRLPSQLFWKPDLVLYNNNDGEYDTTVPVNALLNHTGMVEWLPAAIYKSACKIKVDLFPFDWQNCTMKFRSFTYDKTELYITSAYNKVVVDKAAYRDNGEWTIIHCPIKTNEDVNDPSYQDISLYFIIQRKPLFYIINIIIPCVLISSLSVLVFYLPSGSSEKMTMSISVLLGLTVYLLLLAKRVPETSLGVPLIGAYLLFTMLTVTLSIIFSVVVLNIYHRTPSTSEMPEWVRSLFMGTLPDLLRMEKPLSTRRLLLQTERRKLDDPIVSKNPYTHIARQTERDALLTDAYVEQAIPTAEQNLIILEEYKRNQQLVSSISRRSQHLRSRRTNKANDFQQYLSQSSLRSVNGRKTEKNRRHRKQRQSCHDDRSWKYHGDDLNTTQFLQENIPMNLSEDGWGKEPIVCPEKYLPRSKSCSFDSKKHCAYIKEYQNHGDIATSLPLLGDSLQNNYDQLKEDQGNANPVQDSFENEELYLYKTHNEKIWCSKPRRTDLKGQTRIRNRPRPFQNLRSPHLKPRENGYHSHNTKHTSGDINSPNVTTYESLFIDEEEQDSHYNTPTSTGAANCFESVEFVTNECKSVGKLSEEALLAASAVDFIAENMKTTDKMKIMIEDWHFVATVVDRLLLWIFMLVFLAGTLYFFIKATLNAPPQHPFEDNDPKYAMCWKTDEHHKYHLLE